MSEQNELEKYNEERRQEYEHYEQQNCEHICNEISFNGIITSCKGDIYNPLQCTKCGEFY